jgi:hypothetical protein
MYRRSKVKVPDATGIRHIHMIRCLGRTSMAQYLSHFVANNHHPVDHKQPRVDLAFSSSTDLGSKLFTPTGSASCGSWSKSMCD